MDRNEWNEANRKALAEFEKELLESLKKLRKKLREKVDSR